MPLCSAKCQPPMNTPMKNTKSTLRDSNSQRPRTKKTTSPAYHRIMLPKLALPMPSWSRIQHGSSQASWRSLRSWSSTTTAGPKASSPGRARWIQIAATV